LTIEVVDGAVADMTAPPESDEYPGGRDLQPVCPPLSRESLVPGAWVRVCHAKPGGLTLTMRCTVGGWSDGSLVLLRSFVGGGRYDSIGAPILAGDSGTIEVVPGGWVLRRTYSRADGQLVGELYNIQTPVELTADEVRYVDLEVDVVRLPDGRVEIVDLEDLARAERLSLISSQLAATARAIAARLAEVLRQGGDWRTADQAYRTSA
jgi:hypothetical protein